MFPLGSVLFPGAALPLQVFEPRYRDLVVDVTAGDSRFGVVLIERGSEVGGGDERAHVGTVAEIVRMGEAEDGKILIAAIGRDRIRLVKWLEDDPYPLAMVEPFPEPAASAGVGPALARSLAVRRRLLGLAVEMGAEGQSFDLDLPDDPLQAAWALCAAAPVGSFDRQRLLEIDDAIARLRALEQMLTEQIGDLEAALRRG